MHLLARGLFWLCFASGDGSVILQPNYLSSPRTLCLWLGSTQTSIHFIITDKPSNLLLCLNFSRYTGKVRAIDLTGMAKFCLDSTRMVLFAQGSNGTVRVIELDGTRSEKTLREGLPGLCELAVSPDGKFLATYHPNDDHIDIWNVKSGRVSYRLQTPKASFCSIAFSPNNELLAFAAAETLLIWTFAEERLEQTLNDPLSIRSICFSPDSEDIAIGTAGKPIDFNKWANGDLKSYRREFQQSCETGETAIWNWSNRQRRVLRRWPAPVQQVAYSPDGQTLWAACQTPELFDFSKTNWVFVPPESPKAHSKRKPGELVGIDLESNRLVMPPVPIAGGCQQLSLSPDGRHIGIVANGWTARILRVPGQNKPR